MTEFRMFVRTTNRIGKIALADSKDNGITWSALEPIDLPNPNSGNDAVALTDGAHRAYLQSHRKGRTPLKLAVSPDATAGTCYRQWSPNRASTRIRRLSRQDRNVHVT